MAKEKREEELDRNELELLCRIDDFGKEHSKIETVKTLRSLHRKGLIEFYSDNTMSQCSVPYMTMEGGNWLKNKEKK